MATDGGDRDRTASISREHLSNIFSRRKTVQAGEVTSAQKRPQISQPFNFQHVTQIHRDHLPSIGRGSQATLNNELPTFRTGQMTATGMSNGMQAEDLRVPNFASRATRRHDDDDIAPDDVVPHSRGNSMTRPPSWQKSPTRQTVKQTQSQDQVPRMAPPRPPRSPTQLDLNFDFNLPMPPRRSSRRPSIPRRDSEALANDRSQAIGGFSFPTPPPLHSEASSPPASPSTKTQRRYSRMFVPSPPEPSENPNWPLTCPLNNASALAFEAGLPDVPEEEEHHGPARSRASIRSTNSSLRGSVSVPALRKLSVSDAHGKSHDRTLSRESTVFGHFDMAAAQQAVREQALNTYEDVEPLPRDAWEDVIDYCYEHEAEADCDYDWDRYSMCPDMEPTFLVTGDGANDATLTRPTPNASIGSAFDAQEIISPMNFASATKSPTKSNFSFPRREVLQPQHLHVRSASQASSFKESHGFTLSPSMLIPTDYHQEMLAQQIEHGLEHGLDPESPGQAISYEEPRLNMETSNLFVPARSSASTTTSVGTSRSNFDRHISTISANTDYTRLTMSTSSLNIDDYMPKDESPQAISAEEKEGKFPEAIGVPHVASAMSSHAKSQSIAGLLNRPEQRPLSRDNHSSDPNLAGMRAPKSPFSRGRSRTLSSSPPPPGQYGLFPRPLNTK